MRLKLYAAIRGISGKRFLELDAGQRRNGALFHNELGVRASVATCRGDMVDGGEIGFAESLGGVPTQIEDDFSGADGLSGVGSVDRFSFPSRRAAGHLEVLFVDGNFSGLSSLVDSIFIYVVQKTS